MSDSPADDNVGNRRLPKSSRGKRSTNGARRSGAARPKPSESSLEVIERLLHSPVDTVKDGQATKMTALEAILHQLLQKSMTGDKKADRALQKFTEFAHRNSVPQLEVVFVDNDYTRAFAASKEVNDV